MVVRRSLRAGSAAVEMQPPVTSSQLTTYQYQLGESSRNPLIKTPTSIACSVFSLHTAGPWSKETGAKDFSDKRHPEEEQQGFNRRFYRVCVATIVAEAVKSRLTSSPLRASVWDWWEKYDRSEPDPPDATIQVRQ